MAILWEPPPTAFITCSESDLDVSGEILVESDDPADPVDTIELDVHRELPPQFVISADEQKVSFFTPDLLGIFRIVEILYLRDRVIERCFAWEDLPADAHDIVAYRPDPVNVQIFVLTVTATTTLGIKESEDFVIRVEADYTPGRDLMLGEINARR